MVVAAGVYGRRPRFNCIWELFFGFVFVYRGGLRLATEKDRMSLENIKVFEMNCSFSFAKNLRNRQSKFKLKLTHEVVNSLFLNLGVND